MRLDAVAARYARAVAELAGLKDVAALGTLGAGIDLLARILCGEPELQRWFDDPTVAQADKTEALEALASKAGLSDLIRRFIEVLVEHRRVAALPAIARAVHEIRDEAMGIVPVETTVAVPMSDAETAAFKKALETMTGRTIRLEVKVDPDILGGAVTTIGSRVYDGTLRGGLEALHRRLTAG